MSENNVEQERTLVSESEPKGFRHSVLGWVEEIVFALVVVAVIFTFVCRIITVDGRSMVPTYQHGDRILTTTLTGAPKQGDFVVLVNVLSDPIIKRVVATEGQVVDFDPKHKEITVDGQLLPGSVFEIENGITEVPDWPGEVLQFPQTVPEGCIFVLGDNRTNSKDSRFTEVGMVDARNVLGKGVFNVYPFSKFGLVK